MQPTSPELTISQRVIAVLKGPPFYLGDVHAAQNLDKDLGLDSLDRLELWMLLEQACGLDVPDHIASKMDTVQDIINYMELAQAQEPQWDVSG